MGVKFEVGQRVVINKSYDPYAAPSWREAAIGAEGYVSGVEDDDRLWFTPDVPNDAVGTWFGQWAVLASELDALED